MNPITYSDMESFFVLNSIYPTTSEVEILERLDEIALKQYAKDMKNSEKKGK